MHRSLQLFFVAIVGALTVRATAASATMTMQLNLAQIVAAADRAFVGRVVAVHSDRDRAGIPSTWVTFAVDQVVKGTVGGELTMKQFGTATPLDDGSLLRLPGLPTYTIGEEMVVFLSGESEAGFSSPIGLAQGKFPIVRHAGHAMVAATAENARTLRTLRRFAKPGPQAAAEIPLNDFLDQIGQIIAQSAQP